MLLMKVLKHLKKYLVKKLKLMLFQNEQETNYLLKLILINLENF